MRNRPDFNYLTIISLSLTVVIAMQKGSNSNDNLSLNLSADYDHHICLLSPKVINNAFILNYNGKAALNKIYTQPYYKVLIFSPKELINTKLSNFEGFISTKTKKPCFLEKWNKITNYPFYRSLQLIAYIPSKLNFFEIDNYVELWTSLHSTVISVRAGPIFFV